jgi:nucleoside-diphosphate-sugar epimerase
VTHDRNVLVTGGFGFLGAHLVELLLEEGSTVHVVDNLTSHTIDVNAFIQRTGRFPGKIVPYATSVADFAQRDTGRYDEIYHLASVVGPVGVLDHAGRILSSIVADTYSVIDIAVRHGSRLCDVSTSEIYGGGRNGACSEGDTKLFAADITARSEYAAAKLACEIALVNFSRRMCAPNVRIIRPFNIAGPRQGTKGGFVIPRFLKQAMEGQPLTVYGDGRQVRAFTHVEDIARGMILATRTGAPSFIYNLGNRSNRTTINDLAHLIIGVTKSESIVEHVDPKTLHGASFAEASDKYPDSDLAERELGWKPEHDLFQIVFDAYDYVRKGRRD